MLTIKWTSGKEKEKLDHVTYLFAFECLDFKSSLPRSLFSHAVAVIDAYGKPKKRLLILLILMLWSFL